MHTANRAFWHPMADLERKLKDQKHNIDDDPNSVGALAQAINTQMSKKVIDIGSRVFNRKKILCVFNKILDFFGRFS